MVATKRAWLVVFSGLGVNLTVGILYSWGRLQDKLGPRLVLLASSILAGVGFILSSFNLTVMGLTFFFGIIFGLAIGFGYASSTRQL